MRSHFNNVLCSPGFIHLTYTRHQTQTCQPDCSGCGCGGTIIFCAASRYCMARRQGTLTSSRDHPESPPSRRNFSESVHGDALRHGSVAAVGASVDSGYHPQGKQHRARPCQAARGEVAPSSGLGFPISQSRTIQNREMENGDGDGLRRVRVVDSD